VKPVIMLIIGFFLIFAKFYEIPRNYAEKGKFHGSARNSTTHGKLLVVRILLVAQVETKLHWFDSGGIKLKGKVVA